MLSEYLHDLIKNRQLDSRFQPIVNMRTGGIVGYEALIRGPVGHPLHNPNSLFDVAARCGRLSELDLLAREIHIRNFSRLELPGKLFLNVCPNSLMERKFPRGYTRRFLESHGLSPERVVIELTEHTPIDDYTLFREALSHYRQMGFAIAIDDLGAGYSGLRLWSELHPEYVKLDRHFVQRINEDHSKQQFVHSLLEIALGQGCQTIAEGIETVEEYQTVKKMGITFGQGYLFGRPKPIPSTRPEFIPNLSARASGVETYSGRHTVRIGSLVEKAPVVSPGTLFSRVGEIFEEYPALRSLPVVDDGQVAGLVLREDFMKRAASRFGWDLYGKDPVSAIMETRPIVIETDIPLEKVSRFFEDQEHIYRGQDIILSENGRYAGVVSIIILLRKLTELQIRHARRANPLTLLPGNVPINEHIEGLLQDGLPFTACYCDLDSFKAYNDTYGYAGGDAVIKLLAGMLADAADPELDFVGHIGGDDFMVVFQSRDWRQRCERILNRFAQAIPAHYNRQHREDGGIWGTNRIGESVFMPIITLSIGSIQWDGDIRSSCHEIAAMASEAKAMAKKQPGNSLFVERREPQKIHSDHGPEKKSLVA
jgi:diguanylate cyclase (GGDEF)-like protein